MTDEKQLVPVESEVIAKSANVLDKMFSSSMENGWEAAAVELAKKIFDKDSLLMIARLDDELALFVLRHLIVLNYYAEYWQQVETITTFKRIDVYPYYEVSNDVVRAPVEALSGSYRRWINELLQVTISFKGEGRREVLEVMKSAEAKMLESQLKKQKSGILGGLFG